MELFIFVVLLLEALLILLPAVPNRLGLKHYREGNYVRAERYFRFFYRTSKMVILYAPLRATAANNVGLTEMMQNRLPEAKEFFEEALTNSRKPSSKRTRFLVQSNLAFVEAFHGNLEKAERLLDSMTSEAPLSTALQANAILARAYILLFRGQYADGEALINSSSTLFSDKSGTQTSSSILIACYRLYDNKPDQALNILNSISPSKVHIKHFGAVIETLKMNCYTEMGRLQEAETIQATLLTRIDLMSEFDQRSAYSGIALLASKREDWERARYYADLALSVAKIPHARAYPLLIKARAFVHYNNPIRAKALCEEVLQMPVMPYYHRKAEALLMYLAQKEAAPILVPSYNPSVVAESVYRQQGT